MTDDRLFRTMVARTIFSVAFTAAVFVMFLLA
jgi:hypothetical protein